METQHVDKMAKAITFCEVNKYRFTEPRERVLSLLLKHQKPLGAYEILQLLSSKTAKVQAPTVYRAIDFWRKHGFIHRIESLNAYIACCKAHCHTNFCIFICNHCNKVSELAMNVLPEKITEWLKEQSIAATRSITEISGRCSACSQ